MTITASWQSSSEWLLSMTSTMKEQSAASPVSMLSFTMQVPWKRTASHGIIIPFTGITMTSPGTSSVDMACSISVIKIMNEDWKLQNTHCSQSQGTNKRSIKQFMSFDLCDNCSFVWWSEMNTCLYFVCTLRHEPRCALRPCHAAWHIAETRRETNAGQHSSASWKQRKDLLKCVEKQVTGEQSDSPF